MTTCSPSWAQIDRTIGKITALSDTSIYNGLMVGRAADGLSLAQNDLGALFTLIQTRRQRLVFDGILHLVVTDLAVCSGMQ